MLSKPKLGSREWLKEEMKLTTSQHAYFATVRSGKGSLFLLVAWLCIERMRRRQVQSCDNNQISSVVD